LYSSLTTEHFALLLRMVSIKHYDSVSLFFHLLSDMKIASLLLLMYCRQWPVWLYHIFPHCLMKAWFSEKKSFNIKCVLIFSTLLSETSHSTHNSARRRKCAQIFTYSTRYSCRILIIFDFSGQIFEKSTNMKCIKICLVRAEFFHADRRTDGRTNRQTDMTKLLFFAILRKQQKIIWRKLS
jgi:hypothetical protein